MLSPESSPGRAPVEATERRGRGKGRFAVQHTELSYAFFRTEPGAIIEMDLSTLAQLLVLARNYHISDKDKKDIEEQQGVRHIEIEGMAQTYTGLRGIIDEKDRVVLTVLPAERDIDWNEELLQSSLGPLFTDVVGIRFTAEIPTQLLTPKGTVGSEQIIEVIKKAVAAAFELPEETVLPMLSVERKLDVDKKKLDERVKRKQVVLPEGTRTVGKIVWTITTDDITTS